MNCIKCDKEISKRNTSKMCRECFTNSVKVPNPRCQDCGKEMDRGAKRYCRKCYVKHNKGANCYQWKGGHFCIDCGKPVRFYSKRCRDCYKKQPSKRRRYYCKKCNVEIAISTVLYGSGLCRLCYKRKIKKRKIQNICIDCGKEVSRPEYTRCAKCNTIYRRENDIFSHKYGGKRREQKYCEDCGKAISYLATYCQSCSKKGSKNTFYKKHHTEETIKKLSGKNNYAYNGGKPHCKTCGKLLGNYGSTYCKSCKQLGEKNNFWKGGITPEHRAVRMSAKYKEWRIAVFTRDNWTCNVCEQVGGRLEAHHNKSFTDYPELRFNVDNGITLCKDCHKLTDDYGWKQYRNKQNIVQEAEKLMQSV